MFKVGDRVFIIRGSHQNETGVVTATDSWSGVLTVEVVGWPGAYNVNPEACIRVVPRTVEAGSIGKVCDRLDDLLDGMPTWTH
tara:strand:+ start:95 stop:343 length:249 start_codon:yes stop_codon:yes gene_type:complete